MHPAYRRGLVIVAGTILWALVLHLGYSLLSGPGKPVGVPAGSVALTRPEIGQFELTDQSGRPFGSEQLADKVYIAAFVFTRCPASCPRITALMKSAREKLADTRVEMVSISVDPEHDTPEVLAKFAEANGADPSSWHFLTGPREAVYDLIMKGFRLPVAPADAEAIGRGSEQVLHSDRLVLVDRGNRIVEYFPSEEPDQIGDLIARARSLDGQAGWVRRLPGVNAILNGLSLAFLVLGLLSIRGGKVPAHKALMIAALAVSAAFLACYLVYHFHVGSVPFKRTGPVRMVYFTILLSHTVLAAAMVPMIVLTFLRAFRGDFEAHTRISRVTLPIWMYVSSTGVIIYLMLYQLPASG
ncbi:MAG: DUF420 domain-containing protein [Isosphaeraceae bacterium]